MGKMGMVIQHMSWKRNRLYRAAVGLECGSEVVVHLGKVGELQARRSPPPGRGHACHLSCRAGDDN